MKKNSVGDSCLQSFYSGKVTETKNGHLDCISGNREYFGIKFTTFLPTNWQRYTPF